MNRVIDTTISPNNTNVHVLQKFYNIKLSEIDIGSRYLCVSYDTRMVALIGMEILKDWDIHISKSIKTDKVVLLACTLNRITNDYIKALIDEFDIGNQMIKQLTEKIDYKALEANYINNTLVDAPIDF